MNLESFSVWQHITWPMNVPVVNILNHPMIDGPPGRPGSCAKDAWSIENYGSQNQACHHPNSEVGGIHYIGDFKEWITWAHKISDLIFKMSKKLPHHDFDLTDSSELERKYFCIYFRVLLNDVCKSSSLKLKIMHKI